MFYKTSSSFAYFSIKTCGYSVESPCRGDSNEYLQHMLLWRTFNNYPLVIIKYPPYLFHWTASWNSVGNIVRENL